MGPLFSVITICYNNLAGLQATVESLRRQGFTDYEHIIVDADSTDGTKQYLSELRPQPLFVSEPDRGRFDAMNKGARMASGDLLWFMHSGDVFASDRTLGEVDGYASATDFSWAYGLARLVNAEGRYVGIFGSPSFSRQRFILGRRPLPHQAAIFRRSFYESIGPYREDVGVGADQELMIRATCRTDPIVIPEFVCDFDTTGVGSVPNPIRHYREFAHYRRLSNVTAFRSRAIDSSISGALVLAELATAQLHRRLNTGPGQR